MFITRGRLQRGPFFIGLVPMLQTQQDNLRRMTLPVVTAPCLLAFRLAQPCSRKPRAPFVPPISSPRPRTLFRVAKTAQPAKTGTIVPVENA